MDERTPDEPPQADDLGDEAPDDQRATKPPAHEADPEPTPGDDPGPHGNPAQDEEGLSHEQQDAG
jgi:hypothetical protein